jgi:hypothetical protein
MSAALKGLATALFVLALVLFIMDSPVIGGASLAMGASLMAIAATQKKNDDNG